jgi:hypothetical protein
MERVRGLILRGQQAPPGMELGPELLRDLSTALIDGLAGLHAVELQSTGLAALGRPEGYVRRQVAGWIERYQKARTDEIDGMDRVERWIAANQPRETGAALVHNDYKYDNVVLDPSDGPSCYCGRRGCIETYLSGPAIERAYRERAAEASGERVTVAEIARRARDGETAARTLLAERMDLFGRSLSVVIDVLDPDVVVLGGGVSNLDELYEDGVAAVRRWVFNDTLETRIVRHALGDSAGVLGAALLP